MKLDHYNGWRGIMDKRGLIEGIVALILASIVAFSLLSFSNSYLATDTPQVAVTTGSMLPVYNGYQDTSNSPIHPFRGDLLLVKGEKEYKLGDVIVFDDPRGVTGIPIVHRIIDMKIENGQTFYKTKGDNNQVADPFWVPKENVHGKVIFRIPHVGWLSLLMRSDPYRYILILFIGAIILLSAFKTEEEDEEKEDVEMETEDEQKLVENESMDDMGELERTVVPQADENVLKKNDKILVKDEKTAMNLSRLGRLTIETFCNKYVIIAVLIISVFFFANLATALLSDNEVVLLDRDGNPVDGRTFYLNEPGIYSWESDNGSFVIGIYVQLKMRSSGFFDWIRQVDLTTTSSQLESKTISWTIVYSWLGEKIIDWLVLISVPSGTNVSTLLQSPLEVTINITIHSTGLLSSGTFTKTSRLFLMA